jgi:hypothetical protein
VLAYGAESDRVLGIPGEVCLIRTRVCFACFLFSLSVLSWTAILDTILCRIKGFDETLKNGVCLLFFM